MTEPKPERVRPDDLRTVHDLLTAWSDGLITTSEAIEMTGADSKIELYQAAFDSNVSIPGKPSKEDIELADKFIRATQGQR